MRKGDRLGQTARVHELALVADDTAERLVVSPLLARLRGAGLRQKPMLTALCESRVAAAVMGGVDIATDDGEPAPLPTTVVEASRELAMSAAREVLRLEEARILIRRSRRGSNRQPRLAVSTLRGFRGLASGLYVLLAVEIRDSEGMTLHGDLLAVRIDFDRLRSEHDALHLETRLLETLSELTSRSSFIDSLAASTASRELRRITDLDASRRHRQRERWQAMRDGIGGGQRLASQILVQQGLFDRRAARAAAARAASQTRQLEAIAEAEDTPRALLSMRTEAIAALCVRNRA